MSLLSVPTSIGQLYCLNVTDAADLAREVIDGDCYRLRRLATVFTPRVIHDMGCNIGDASMLARSLWSDAQIVAFDASEDLLTIADANVDAIFRCGVVGYGLRAVDLTSHYGFPDLFKIDTEGGEVPFFYDLFRYGGLDRYRVIVGEWHGKPAKELLRSVLSPMFDTLFLDGEACDHFFAVHKGESEAIREALFA